jgi:Tfp pilus assembly protein PilV
MMKGQASAPTRRGTSLVEAVVALAVMAFGMLAVVAVQSTLRHNADIAKQRSEAVRIAQEAIEAARAFSVIDAPEAGQASYDAVTTAAPQAVNGYTTNTTYTLTRSVVTTSNPPGKAIRVSVAWTDRNGDAQGVELDSFVAGIDPRVSMLLGARPNGIPARIPHGRHPAIPPQAIQIGGDRSAFKPPMPDGGESTVVWVFDNLTGVIVGVCTGVTTVQAALTAADVSSCSTNTNAQLLTGFVRFATDPAPPGTPVQPTASDAENPTSTARNLAIVLTLASTGHPVPDHACVAVAPTDAASGVTAVPYYCVIFTNPSGMWSGISEIAPLAFVEPIGDTAWTIAASAADTDPSHFRVCRYTPATSDAQVVPNRDHPRSYSAVAFPLINQNFLVIRAGDGSTAFTCPTDVPADPDSGDLVNSNTLVHQPAP